MRARRTQLYWFPFVSALAVVAGGILLDLPGRAALFRSSEYGIQIWPVGTASFLGWSLGVLAVAWAAQAMTDRPRRPSPISHHVYHAAFGVLYVDVLFLAGAHGRGVDETGVTYWALLGVVPAAWLGRHVASRLEDARAEEEGEWDAGPVKRPSLRLGANERALWVGRRECWGYRPILYLSGPSTALAVAWAIGYAGIAATPQVVFFVGSLLWHYATCSAEVTVWEDGVRVVAGVFRLPVLRVPLDAVAEARVEEVRPGAFGGYGYLRKGGRRCLVVRAGPGLLLRRRAGRDVMVTVEGAEEGAALLNGLIARRSAAGVRGRA
jgi:hypothetical protein